MRDFELMDVVFAFLFSGLTLGLLWVIGFTSFMEWRKFELNQGKTKIEISQEFKQ